LGEFLNFAIPLIILGFVAPGIGNLGKGAGKILAITAGIAYVSTVFAGSLAYFSNSIVLPRIIDPNNIATSLESAGNQMAKAFIEIQPPLLWVL
jgi:Na+/H+-dicarboxylate symporter